MSDKLEALKATLERLGDAPAPNAVRSVTDLLRPPYYIPGSDPIQYVLPEGTLELGEEVERLREIKTLVTSLEAAVSEYTKEVELALHAAMSTRGPVGFTTKSGFKFSMTKQNIVQANKEQGGTGNPNLKQWLVDNGMPDVAEGTINANTLKSSINKWIEANPIEAVRQVGDDNVILEGAELLEELDIDQAEFDRRAAEHERLRGMVTIDSRPAISMTKA